MKIETANTYIGFFTKIFGALFSLLIIGFIFYNVFLSTPNIEKQRKACQEEKQVSFHGVVDSFYRDNFSGSIFIRLTNGFQYTIPHSHKEGLSIDKRDSVVKEKGRNIYFIYDYYASLGIDTADFECNCNNNKCLDAYY